MGDKVLCEMELLESLARVSPGKLRLYLIRDMISVSFLDRKCGAECVPVSVWVMKEYGAVKSWTRLSIVDLQRDLLMIFSFTDCGVFDGD